MAVPGPNKPSKGLLTKKIGPLPTWAWMIVGLGIAVMIASMNKSKKASEAADKTAEGDGTYGVNDYGGSGYGVYLGGSQRPPVIFQNYTSQIGMPPMGGRPFPPCAPGSPLPCPPSPGRWVSVPGRRGPKGAHGNPLAALARELFGSPDAWRAIWEAPENQALRSRRKTPMRLQGGDRVWVPNLGANGQPCPPGDPSCPPPASPACPPGSPPPCPPMPPPVLPCPPGPAGQPGGYGNHQPPPGRAGGRRYSRHR